MSGPAVVLIHAGRHTISPAWNCLSLAAFLGSFEEGKPDDLSLEAKISSFGGCFAFRQQRRGAKLSTHRWGIAIDPNPGTNWQSSPGNMVAGLIDVSTALDSSGKATWPRRTQDAMHFQFCSGYWGRVRRTTATWEVSRGVISVGCKIPTRENHDQTLSCLCYLRYRGIN